MFGRTKDTLLARRQDWTGAVVLNAADGESQHYWRVTYSYRNPETGEWWINADEYLGTTRPKGPVYRFDNTTWDMPALPATVMGPALLQGIGIGLVTAWVILGFYLIAGCQDMAGMTALVLPLSLLIGILTSVGMHTNSKATMLALYALDALLAIGYVQRRREEDAFLYNQAVEYQTQQAIWHAAHDPQPVQPSVVYPPVPGIAPVGVAVQAHHNHHPFGVHS